MKLLSIFNRNVRLASLFIVSVVTTACGGGGGSSGSFSLNTSSVSFSAMESEQALESKSVRGSVSGVDQNVYIFVDASTTPLIQDAYVSINGQTGTLYLYPVEPAFLGVGQHSGSVIVSVCFDASCRSHVNGSPKTLNVSYTVTADPNLIDTDNDGTPDVLDEFPTDSSETQDADQDGKGDNEDLDDDNDDYPDLVDRFPFDPTEWADNDNDLMGDNSDDNDDNDAFLDIDDAFPFDPELPSVISAVSAGSAITHIDTTFTVSGIQFNDRSVFYVNDEPIDVTLSSDSVARFNYTPTTPGDLKVSVKHTGESYESSVNFSVASALYFPYAVINTGGDIYKTYYDTSRQSLYYHNAGLSQISKLTHTSGGAWQQTDIAIAGLRSFAFSQDKQTLVAITEDELIQIDPEGLFIVETMRLTLDLWNTVLSDAEFDILGRLLITTDFQGSGSTEVIAVNLKTQEQYVVANYLYNSAIAASTDGSLVLFGENGLSPTQPLYTYRPLSDEFEDAPVRVSYSNAAIDAIGSRLLVNNYKLYDAGFNTLAELNTPDWVTASDLSADGHVIIAVDYSGTIHYFDVEHAQNALVVPDYSAALADGIGFVRSVVMSEDQLTVFVMGENKVQVIPVWQLLEGVVGSSQTCPSVGCGDIALADGVLAPGDDIVIPEPDQQPSPAAYISPAYAGVGEVFETVITGSGFAPASIVQFGAALADNVRYINDEMMVATIPADLAAGDYTITVDGHQGDAPVFSVIEQAPVTDTSWPIAGRYQELRYLPQAHALIALELDNHTLIRIDLSDNSLISTALAEVTDVTWCANDGYLYIATGSAVQRYDATTLDHVDNVVFTTVDRLECMAEGQLFLTAEDQWQDSKVLTLDPVSLTSSLDFAGYPAGSLYSPTVDGVSRRGDVVYFGESGISSPDRAIFRSLDLSYSLIDDIGAFITSSWSADSSVGVVNANYVRGASFSLTGSLSSLGLGYPDVSVVTGTGDIIYSVIDNAVHRISLVDGVLTAVDSKPLQFDPGYAPRADVSLDGKTVFVAGSDGIEAISF